MIKSSPSNYFTHNLQLRLPLVLFSSTHTDLYLECDHSNRLVDLYLEYSVVISSRFRGISKIFGSNFNLQIRLQLEIHPSSIYLEWDKSNRFVELFSYYFNATAMEENCKKGLWSDLKEHSRISSTDHQAEVDQKNARVTKLRKATVQPDDSQTGNQTTMVVDTNVGMLPLSGA